ncbi:hypothetical protein PQJ75_29010 [Rhodoplanes sp. TEM]|uniref:DUF2125 domain-containing protein n=1 Tax=Rhodoplanes tepidamans TaxID=200616 RepID=A0ABT5JK46_RHOTP|nr:MULTISPECIES: hypothetical protein [Rhodoplanes]MDC7789971.1 hypothetical protein [Rhodoplanes tepidamans]MDC7987794.1 hypothetical protein [Rhodoplanes sp. TEM]MDQ0353930.1 hypothetical protein [Rhodoplanes tepidamans]
MRTTRWQALAVGCGLALLGTGADAQGLGDAVRDAGAAVARMRAGTIEIKDVTLGGPDGSALAIGRAAFAGFSREGGTVVASRLAIETVTATVGTQSWQIPRITLDGVRIPEELYRALAEGAATTRPWPDLFREVAADLVTIETLTVTDRTAKTEQVLSGFVLSRLARGVIGTARMASIVGTAAPDPATPVRVKTGAVRYQDLDIGESLRIVTGGDGTARRVMTSASIDGMEIVTPAVTVRLGTYEVGPVTLAVPAEPMPTDLAALATELQAGAQPDQAVVARLVRWYRGLLRGLKVESVAFRDIAVTGPDVDLKIAAVTLGGMVPSGFDLFEVTGIEASTPDGPVRLGRLAVEKADFAALLDLGLDAAETGRGPEIEPSRIVDLLPQIGAVRLAGLDAATPDGPVTLGALDIEIDRPGRLPERLALAVTRLALPVGPGDGADGREVLAHLGYTAIRADMTTQLRWLPADRALVLDDTALAVADAGRIEASVRIDDVDLAAALADPDRADAILAGRARLGGFEVTIADLGFADRFYADLAKSAGVTVPAARDRLAAETRAQAAEAFGSALPSAALDKIAAFVRRPGRIVVAASPRPGQTVRLSDLETLGPKALARMRLDIEVEPPR